MLNYEARSRYYSAPFGVSRYLAANYDIALSAPLPPFQKPLHSLRLEKHSPPKTNLAVRSYPDS
jgi:hypothetical protein